MRYIYRLFVGYHLKDMLSYITVFSDNYFTREEAIEAGKSSINFFIENRVDSIKEFLDIYDYEFYIYITDLKRIPFNDFTDRLNYIKGNKPANGPKLYEFLIQTAEDAYEVYDYNGHLIKGVIYPWERYITYKTDFKPINLKIGDLVKKVGYDEVYKVVDIPDNITRYDDIVYILPKDNEYDDIEDSEGYASTELIKID